MEAKHGQVELQPGTGAERADRDDCTNRYKIDANGTGADGKPMHIEFDAKFDGKDYPMIGVPWADTLSVKWIDADSPQIIQKERDHVTVIITCRVSANGKTRTCTLEGMDQEGRKVNNVVVFDRQ